MSPLAFATDTGDRSDRGSGGENSTFVEDDSVERNQVNQCEFEQDSASTGLLGPLLPLLNQSQQLNCVNELFPTWREAGWRAAAWRYRNE